MRRQAGGGLRREERLGRVPPLLVEFARPRRARELAFERVSPFVGQPIGGGRAARALGHARIRAERRKHLREHAPQWLLVISRDEAREVENVGGERRHVAEDRDNGLELVARDVGCICDIEDDPDEAATAKPHAHQRAALDGKPRRHPVIEG